ncbi:MAG: hypothetical protein KME55_39470 [Nostoc indistinguendum CM1-VF10]|nr:hypothetical protein [Nostoc indistinguendum CM1-VF10]
MTPSYSHADLLLKRAITRMYCSTALMKAAFSLTRMARLLSVNPWYSWMKGCGVAGIGV